jgi:uncharacterized protein YdcH (DUF465 family)
MRRLFAKESKLEDEIKQAEHSNISEFRCLMTSVA